jgi:DNA recombination-dependent growth factor C
MNILQICSKPPFPEKDGYALAVNHITNALIQKGNDLKVMAISTPKHAAENIPKQYLIDTNFGYIFIVCATGKSAEEMLALLKVRLENDPEAELLIAAKEQNKITQLRLDNLLSL